MSIHYDVPEDLSVRKARNTFKSSMNRSTNYSCTA